LFFIGLVLAGGTMWALLHLFGADASKPLSAAALSFAQAAVV
jgi:cytochrome c oxidase subunit 4